MRVIRNVLWGVLLACGLVACGESSAVESLVEKWNSPRGEKLVLEGPIDPGLIVEEDEDGNADENLRATALKAFTELVQGCYALPLSMGKSGDAYYFLRAKKEDNPACETIVVEQWLHSDGPGIAYQCDFQNVRPVISASSNHWPPSWDKNADFNDIMLNSCTRLSAPYALLDEGHPCVRSWNSKFNCGVGNHCVPYYIDNDEPSELGRCEPIHTKEEALEALLTGRGMTRLRKGAWPYEMYTTLGYDEHSSEDWTAFWRRIFKGRYAMYLTIDGAQGETLTFFLGVPVGIPTLHTAFEYTLVAVESDDSNPVYAFCEGFETEAMNFDEDGRLLDVAAFTQTLPTHCTLLDDPNILEGNQVCPADENSPFGCKESDCYTITGAWLGHCPY